jgi:cysteine-rich repeat protein
MRAPLVALLIAGASACSGTNRCASNTVLLDLTLGGGAERADQLQITVSIDNGGAHNSMLPHQSGSQHGTVEVDFHGAYPAGHNALVVVNAMAAGNLLATASKSFTFDPRCSAIPLTLLGAGGNDLSTRGDLGAADFSIPPDDLSVPPDDLSMPIDGAAKDLATSDSAFSTIDLAMSIDLAGADLAYPTFAGPVSDFDVGGDGSLFMVYSDGRNITGHCFAPDGSVRQASFSIFGNGQIVSYLRVQTARTSRTSLVSWTVADPTDAAPGQIQIMSRLYDLNCLPVGAAFAWPGGPGGQYVFDAAIDAVGNSYLLWTSPTTTTNTYLSFYNASGVKTTSDLLVDSTSRCGNGYGMHVAVNATTGNGVVTCQLHEDSPVRYRRFNATGVFVDPALVDIAESANNHSSWYESHQVGVADDGSFVVEWQDATNRTFRANFYTSAATLVGTVTLGPAAPPFFQYYDGFRGLRASVELSGGNYVLRDGFQGKQFWIYSTTSSLNGCDQAPTNSAILRTGATTRNWITSSSLVVEGELAFTRYNVCAPPTCGNGTLDAYEQCDDGNREPYDGCNEFCKLEYCGDKLVTASEQCDDGPAGSALCDTTCHFKTQTPPTTASITGADDFDVANDGTLVTTQLDPLSHVLYATCYAPDHTLVRERFPVAPVEYSISFPMVVTSRVSKKSLVSWLSANNLVGIKLFDANCLAVGPHVNAITPASELYDTAIDDLGRPVVAANTFGGTTGSLVLYDATLTRIGTPLTITSTAALYGIHVALNQAVGGGVVSFQGYSGSVLYYQRFASNALFLDAAPVLTSATVQWYDGHTVGVNDLGQIVFEWRDNSGFVQAAFYPAIPGPVAATTVSTRVRASEEGSYYDSFRRRHEKIPLKSGNFVLGETYNWLATVLSPGTDAATDITQEWFVYTPAGAQLSTYTNTFGVDSGLNARYSNGVSYFLQRGTIYFGSGEL